MEEATVENVDGKKVESISFDELLQQRDEFYHKLKSSLPLNARGLYPAPGLDPVPVHTFGPSVTYLSLPNDGQEHMAILRGELSIEGGQYGKFINEHGPFPNLSSTFGDIFLPPFADEEFDVIILRNPPFSYLDPELKMQLDRILKSGGLLIFDNEDENQLEVEEYIQRGYLLDEELDLWGGKFKVYPTKKQINDEEWLLGTHQYRVLKKK